jgi:hypothetical protein
VITAARAAASVAADALDAGPCVAPVALVRAPRFQLARLIRDKRFELLQAQLLRQDQSLAQTQLVHLVFL